MGTCMTFVNVPHVPFAVHSMSGDDESDPLTLTEQGVGFSKTLWNGTKMPLAPESSIHCRLSGSTHALLVAIASVFVESFFPADKALVVVTRAWEKFSAPTILRKNFLVVLTASNF